MTPALKGVPAIPFVSRYPAISFPLLLAWPFVGYLLARSYLRRTTVDKAPEGLKLGLTFALVNFVLDLLVLVLLFKNGFSYFASLTVWVAYFLLLIIPWLTARSLALTTHP
ncbi:MAG TPA: hypothetical protein VMZ30_01670 [Pyrinomonadaceae bacterium]|nr:hypothetical protein [Pyrinomonadaceae bacterium]